MSGKVFFIGRVSQTQPGEEEKREEDGETHGGVSVRSRQAGQQTAIIADTETAGKRCDGVKDPPVRRLQFDPALPK